MLDKSVLVFKESQKETILGFQGAILGVRGGESHKKIKIILSFKVNQLTPDLFQVAMSHIS